MAAPDLRIVRRPRGQTRPALVAASAPIDNPNATFKNQVGLSQRTGWQTRAWEYLDKVGELRYYVSWRSNACSQVRLVASELDDQGRPTGHCENEAVNRIASAIGGTHLQRTAWLKRTVECLSVVGETFTAILFLPDSPPQGTWFTFSRDEIRKSGPNETVVELPDGTEHTLVKGVDSLRRVWEPHPRRAKEADSPVRAADDSLAEIVRTTRKIRHADTSRLIGAGVVFVPQEMSLPAVQGTPAIDGHLGGVPTPVSLQGATAAGQLNEMLFDVAKAALKNEDSFAAQIPLFASVPGEMINKVQHLKFGDDVTDLAIKTRNDAIARLAMSLEVSPERLLGLGSSTNHWSAWAIGDDDVQLHIAPAMKTICDAVTQWVFHPALERAGIDPAKYVLWYDASGLTEDPDKTDDATDAFDRGAITADAYREFLGLGATGYNLVSGDLSEWRKWAVDQVANEPTLITTLLPLLGDEVQNLDFPQAAAIEGSQGGEGRSDSTNEGDDPDTEDEDPGYDQGKRGRKEDVAKNVTGVVELLVRRCLELAGKRRRAYDPASRDRLRGHRAHEFHRLMEPVREDEVLKLIRGWDDILDDDFALAHGIDPEVLRAEVKRQVTAELTTVVIDA